MQSEIKEKLDKINKLIAQYESIRDELQAKLKPINLHVAEDATCEGCQ